MKSMKWEAIKKKAAKWVYDRVNSQEITNEAALEICFDMIAERRSFAGSAKALADKCWDVVMNWDVRGVRGLRNLVPKAFPKYLMGAIYSDYDEDGDWAIFPKD